MRRKLTRNIEQRASSIEYRARAKAFTITEVAVASALLLIAIIPILKALTISTTTSITIERRMRSLTLAQGKLEDIKARSIYNYGTSFADASSSIDGAYLCKVLDTTVTSVLRRIDVSVGYDQNSNSVLDDSEVEVTLNTLIAQRWP